MTKSIRLTLPLPPSVNALYGGGSGQRRFASKAYKAWKAEVEQIPRFTHFANLTPPLCVSYKFYWPDKRVRDQANFLKALDDWMVTKKIVADDNWLVLQKQVLESALCKADPRVEIEICELHVVVGDKIDARP